MTKQYFTSCC